MVVFVVFIVLLFVCARLAQSVEHQTSNLKVKGSSPLSGQVSFSMHPLFCRFILTELLQTEKDYLGSLERLINGYLKEMQSPNLPDSLKGMEKLIFGNIQDVFKFHDT